MEYDHPDVFLEQPRPSSEKVSQYKACLDEFAALDYDDVYLQEIKLEMSVMLKRAAAQ